jgi:ribonuclease HI
MPDTKTTHHPPHIVIYTDGACKGNPGPGGWGAVLRSGNHEKHIHGGEKLTTNNRMEISAVIFALRALKQRSSVELWTDSQYVQKGVTEWLEGWKKRGWKTASKDPVKNADLWQRLEAAAAPHDVSWHWVRGQWQQVFRCQCGGQWRKGRGQWRSV